MANFGFFSMFTNYSRPGPGVRKDEPKKPPYIRYFQLMGRKYSKLIQLNLLFLVPVLVSLVLMVLLFFAAPVHYVLEVKVQGYSLVLDLWNMYVVPLPLVLISPFVAGITYVTRNFAREEHAFIFSDFKDAIKENWKAFLVNGFILYVAYILLSFSMLYYYNQSVTNWFFIIPFSLCFLVAIILLFCQYYIPVMLVTFDLSLKQVYRNALIFSIAGLGRNLLLTAIFVTMVVVMFIAVSYMVLTLLIALVFVLLFMFSFISYTTNFIIQSLIEKYLLQPFYRQQEEEAKKKAGIVEEPKEDRTDKAGEMDEEEAPEYVYVNGRLRKRSELEEDQLFEDKHY